MLSYLNYLLLKLRIVLNSRPQRPGDALVLHGLRTAQGLDALEGVAQPVDLVLEQSIGEVAGKVLPLRHLDGEGQVAPGLLGVLGHGEGKPGE